MIVLLTVLRLIPYILAGLVALQKGYYRLTAAAAILVTIAVLSLTVHPSPEVIASEAGVFSVALLFHALDLKQRPKGKRKPNDTEGGEA